MWFLLLFVLVIVGRFHEAVPAIGPLRLGLVSGGFALLSWMLAPGSLHDKIPFAIPQVRYVGILFGLAIATIPVGVWPGNSLDYLTQVYWKVVVLFLLVLFWSRTVKDMRCVVWACCLGVIGLVVSALLTGRGGEIRFDADSKTYGSNELALVLVMVLPLLLYLLSTSRLLAKLLLSGMVLVCLYGIMLTRSRGGLLALSVVGALILWRSTLTRMSKVMIALAVLLVFGVLADDAYWDRIKTIWAPQSEYDRTAGARTPVWQTGLTIMATQPWGVGINGFGIAEGLSHGGTGIWWAPHNSFLQIGVELGVGGLIVFLLVIVRALGDLRHIQTKAKETPAPNPLAPLGTALEASLLGFVVAGFFLSQAYSALLYVVLALSAASTRVARSAIPASS